MISIARSIAGLADLRAAAPVWIALGLPLTDQALAQSTDDPPSDEMVDAITETLDRAFEQRSSDAFLAPFRTIHSGHELAIRAELERLFGYDVDCTRTTDILERWTVGDHGVAHLRSTVRLEGFEEEPFVEHFLLAVRVLDREPVVTLLVEAASELMPAFDRSGRPDGIGARFRCQVCNFDVESGDNWLAVPVCHEPLGCIEALSFYSLDQDVCVHVTVHLDDQDFHPTAPLKRLTRFGRNPEVEPWTPPAHQLESNRPKGLRGARARFSSQLTDRRTEAYFVTFGRVGYLIQVEGAADAIDRRMSDVEELLASFRLTDIDLSPEQLAQQITEHRRAGVVEGGNRYRNDAYGLTLDAPGDWTAELETGGGSIFDLRFGHPQRDCFVHARGFAPMRGTESWNDQSADAMASSMLRDERLRVDLQEDWREVGDLRVRDSVLHDETGHQILLRLVVRDDLLILLEARSDRASDTTVLREIFDSLGA